MALPTENADARFGDDPDDGNSFWLQMMNECLNNTSVKLSPSKRILILGDNEAEMTQLVLKLQGCAVDATLPKRGNGLEYHFFNVRDEYCENQAKLGIWILDGDPCFKPLLKYALNKETIADTTVLLAASMTKPWDIFSTIRTWAQIVKEHIENLGLPSTVVEERRKKVLERYREYVEPGLSIYGSLPSENNRELAVNLGVEIILVITRTEYMKELQTEYGYEDEHFDYIQFTLREFCLSYGAGLFYISVKEDKNCDLFLKYILHKVYSFPFRIPAVLLERDSVFVPAGWDSENKIRYLSETLTTIPLSMPFEEVVFKPARFLETKRNAPEIVADDDQEFLTAMQSALTRQVTDDASTESSREGTSMTAAVVQRNVARRVSRTQAVRTTPQKKLEMKLSTGEGETVLNTFFKSLLNRRTSAPADRPLGFSGSRTYAPRTAAECLDSSLDNASRLGNNDSYLSEQPQQAGQGKQSNVSGNHQDISGANKFLEDPDFTSMSTFLRDIDKNVNSSNSTHHSKLRNAVHLSLDQDKGVQQLPEYFMSNAAAGFCGGDCCFQRDANSPNGDLDDDIGLDRVRSSFNPPLRLILEKPDAQPHIEQRTAVVNGFAQSSSTKQHVTSTKEHNASNSSLPEARHGDHEDMLPSPKSAESDAVISSMPCRKDSHNKNTVTKS